MKNKTWNTRKARYFLYALLVVVLLTSCESGGDSNAESQNKINSKSINKSSMHRDDYEMRIIEHEGHEYIILVGGASWGNGLAICHSESCLCKNGN